ncbi:MAG: hypothetical protein Q4F99_06995 [bacterium]|nr:hypothetical protein [bacterium]
MPMTNLRTPDVYDKKALYWGLFGIALSCGLMATLPMGSGFLILLPIALVGFGGNRTLLLMWTLLAATIFTMGNPYLFNKGMIFLYSNRLLYLLVAMIMTFQIIGQRKAVTVKPFLFLLAFLVYMTAISAQGWNPLISYMKLILFTVIYLAFYSVANASATRWNVRDEVLRSIFLGFACFIILGSIALIPFPAISTLSAARALEQFGYIPEGALFMGVTGQSQTLGPLVAVVTTFLLADWLFNVKRWSWLYALLFACTPILIIKTGSRTAMGTYLAGLLFVGFLFMRARGVGGKWKSRALTVGFLLGTFAILGLFATPAARQSVTNFVFKTRGGTIEKHQQTWERLTSSRQGLVDEMKENIAEKPMVGNGFQVMKSMEHIEIVSIAQLLSQPVEKGVWIYAVMEDGGIFGMLLFCFFLITVFYTLLKHRVYVTASAFFVFVVSNFGEYTFFSMSGMAGIFWALIFVGTVFDAHTLRRRQREQLAAGAANYDLRITNYDSGSSGYGPVNQL